MSDFWYQVLALIAVLLAFAVAIACVAIPFRRYEREEQARYERKRETGRLQTSITNTAKNQAIRNEIALDIEKLPALEDDPHDALTMSQSIVHRKIEERYWNRVILPNYNTIPALPAQHRTDEDTQIMAAIQKRR